ncbi:cuticlin-5 [Lycorma delicatula]|uniref:cuticlin-5 n=1 Tax=Lycorma delicatula TaxID=130591 RepID=UPI003F5166A1
MANKTYDKIREGIRQKEEEFLKLKMVRITSGHLSEITTEPTASGSGVGVEPTESMIAVEQEDQDPAATSTQDVNDDSLRDTNETREALSHDGSEHSSVVFVGDGYVPVSTQLRSRPISHTEPQLLDWRLQTVEGWDARRHGNNKTRVQHIEAECQDDYMKIRIGFNGSFGGLLYSSGYSYDPDCVYINGTGRDYYEFYIQLNRCGTLGKNSRQEDARKNPAKNLMWNTVTVQYNPLIEEEWDEHFKVTCEYGYDFWKTVTFPFLDVEVATGNPVVFTLSPPECYMEIRYGYGTAGNRVGGPVRVGDPLTLIIYMRSKYDGFDIVVNDCYAHNGANKRIQLIDQYGCPVDDKLISRFRGSWSESGVFETQVFAYMKTFRFTGSPALYIECDVRMCHGRCPSQPCHWRNAKSVTKRSIEETITPVPLSQNINLFQSLRVLQEGEGPEEAALTNGTVRNSEHQNPNSVCMRSGLLAALLAFGSTLLCILSLALTVMCYRARRLAKVVDEPQLSTPPPRCFLTHKGRIN